MDPAGILGWGHMMPDPNLAQKRRFGDGGPRFGDHGQLICGFLCGVSSLWWVFCYEGFAFAEKRYGGDAARRKHLGRSMCCRAGNTVGSWGSASFLGLWSKTS